MDAHVAGQLYEMTLCVAGKAVLEDVEEASM
jgi:hypothetical protein